jgi:hypothetical protein
LKIGKKGRKSNKYFLFVDFKRAFDLVDRAKLVEFLGEYLEDSNILDLVKELLQP